LNLLEVIDYALNDCFTANAPRFSEVRFSELLHVAQFVAENFPERELTQSMVFFPQACVVVADGQQVFYQ